MRERKRILTQKEARELVREYFAQDQPVPACVEQMALGKVKQDAKQRRAYELAVLERWYRL